MEKQFFGITPAENVEKLLTLLPEWQRETAKSQFLDYLYNLYDRDSAPIGLRGTYSGLLERYMRETAQLACLSLYLNQ